ARWGFAASGVGTARGLGGMGILTGGDYESSVPRKGAYFLGKLRELQAKHREIGEVDALGLALRMEMCEADGYTPSRRLADRMFQLGLEGDLAIGSRTLGLVLDIGGYYKNVITLPPSPAITTGGMDLPALALRPGIT